MVDKSARYASLSTTARAIVVAVLLVFVAAYAGLFAYAMQRTTYEVWGVLLLAPALIAVSVPILLRLGRDEPDSFIQKLFIGALVLKILASIPRYYMVTEMYGTGDSLRYAGTAALLRVDFLEFDFSLAPLGSESRTGTQFVEIVTGIVYTITGPSMMGGFVFFSWLSFWGLCFFYRAFRVGVPDGDARRYAVLLFFLPSMLFWPSSIGKEAWMTLVLGIATYGAALLLARRRGASVYLALGLAGVLMVRPHMALLTIAGLALGYAIRGSGAQRVVALGRTRTLIGLAVIGAFTLLATRRVAAFFGVDEFNLDTATETLEYAERQTTGGGSEYAGGGPSFKNLPMNIVTVLFRPFPFEVSNIQSLLAALEGVTLIVLFILALPRLRTVPKRLRKQPYITYCITYSLLFCFMFSAFQNFGILARQRVLVFPLVLVLLALPLGSSSGLKRTRRSATPKSSSITSYAVATRQ